MRACNEVPRVAATPMGTIVALIAGQVGIVATMIDIEAGRDCPDDDLVNVAVRRISQPIDHDLNVTLAVTSSADRMATVWSARCVDLGGYVRGERISIVRMHRGYLRGVRPAAGDTARRPHFTRGTYS